MRWADTLRFINFVLGVAMIAGTIRVVREQLRRDWGDHFQYVRFAALGGWCFLNGSVIISLHTYPLTWRTYVATVLQLLSILGIYGIRRQQKAAPPGEDHEYRPGFGRIGSDDPAQRSATRWSPDGVRRRRRPPDR